jgi:hypothetical protein
MIVVLPGRDFTWQINTGLTGLTGTIGTRILDGAGTATPRSTAGITELPAGSGIYQAALTAPDTRNQYELVADTGGTAPVYFTDDLVVSSTNPDAIGSAVLCTLDDVRSFNSIEADDTSLDSEIERTISDITALIIADADGREIIPPSVSESTRRFDLLDKHWTRTRGCWELPVGDLQTAPSDVSIESALGDVIQTAVANIVALPRVRKESWQPITRIRLPWTSNAGYAYIQPNVIAVTGLWGFPEVPGFVRQACIVGVSLSLAKDVERFSETFGSEARGLVIPGALPSRVRKMLNPLRARPV